VGRMDLVDRGRKPGRVRQLACTAGLTALAGLLAACSSSGSSSSTAAGSASSAPATSASQASGSTPAAAGSSASAFVAIVEPFDPGHPARTASAPASCDGATSTLAIEQCYDAKTENVDAAIDTVQLARYTSATAAGKAAIVAQDSAWLAARQPVCAVAYHSGGTIDGINTAICLLDESTARLDGVKGITPPEARLKATDSTDLSQLSWYTTAEGSRTGEINTQGDQTGGVIVAWVIIGGASGFTVNPKQFYFSHGSFTDPGIVQGSSPVGHRVATGQQYQFSIDYSHLSANPAGPAPGGYLYAPGYPAALWGE
jgi:uncharacterized protein YecT (DUF1311 family)